ncbi:unnamed protein product [Phaedon cochleariae]|uniref:Protein cueball n=1 Tax=Phaedon cochleariae TaxID=80249 RepID=A0A9N9SGI4_PHACE|nr:unnamed protein product [Phaedon cochleariae]
MLIKLSVICVLIHIGYVRNERLDWDLAVVVGNEISLLHTDGTIFESKTQPFSSLKALAYDDVRDQFIVSDMDMKNDTIYTVQLSKETDKTVPIVNGLPGDVQGLAVDPIEDVLYWTDAINHTINYVLLNETTFEPKEFLVFEEEVPHALAIDVCKRYLYFTNPGHTPTIERIKLDKSEREVIVDNLIMSPVGLTIDYKAQKLYWVDSRIGTSSGRIESINLDKTNRQIVIERNTMEPFGIAVDEEAIYWTDTNNNALYSSSKNGKGMIKLRSFPGKPMGLVSNNNIIKEEPDCSALEAAIKEYHQKDKEAEPIPVVEKDEVKECLNDGELEGNHCICKRGFTGIRCESSICSEFYCLNGNCYLSTLGKPQCHCKRGFLGDRCQQNKCDRFCLNGGECSLFSTRDLPKCRCAEGFLGDRCEYNIQICDMYCQNISNAGFSDKFESLCRCTEYSGFSGNKIAALQAPADQGDFLDRLKDPVVYLSAVVLFCLLVIIAMGVYIRTVQKKRPRIKKRIIVNKNVTPLTYRPQPSSEQCEITIENCCNMNVCETPCFEPREDKKKLLTNMEGDELY